MSSANPSTTPEPRWMAAVWAALFACLAVAITWPLAPHLADHLPKGNVPTSVPALAATWALWWVSDRLPHAFMGLWDAPIFFPVQGTFAFSETTLPLGVLTAPLFWLGFPPPVAYNLVVLACMAANGLAARTLSRELGCGPVASGGAGALLVASPLLLRNLSVLPMVPVFGILWFCVAVLRFARQPSAATGAWVGAMYALTLLLSLQYGLYLTLMAPGLLVALHWKDRRRWATGVVTGAWVAFVLLGPVLVPQRAHLQSQGFERSTARSQGGAATLSKNWLNPPRPGRLPLPGLSKRAGAGQFPGLAIVGLVVAGVIVRRDDRRTWALAAMAAGSVALSTMPTWEVAGWEPYETLRDWVPGLDRIRETRRGGCVATALLPVLAALGLDALTRRTHALIPAGVVAVALVHHWPDPHRLQAAPDFAAQAPINAALRAHVPDDGAVIFVPVARRDTETPEADRMVLQAHHGRRMVNGYSSYYPATYRHIKRALVKGPGPAGFDALRDAGVTHVVAPSAMDRFDELDRIWGPEGTDDTLFLLR